MVRLPQGWKPGARPTSPDGSGDWPEESPSLPLDSTVRARDNDLERDVAMSRFRREARLLAAVHHPNIATLFGTFEHGGVRFLVWSWWTGRPWPRGWERAGSWRSGPSRGFPPRRNTPSRRSGCGRRRCGRAWGWSPARRSSIASSRPAGRRDAGREMQSRVRSMQASGRP